MKRDRADFFDGKGTDAPEARPCLPCLNSDNSINEPEEPKPSLTSSQKKTAYALGLNVDTFINLVGIDRVGFLTLTFGDHVTEWKEGQRRFNSMMTDYGRHRFPRYVCVMEPQKSGRLHYHLLVDCLHNIRSGLSFEEIKRGQYRSAGKELRRLWKELRDNLPRYGFGRHELLPVKSNAEGMSKYIAKYISKGAEQRDDRFKGARWVRYSKGWRSALSQFAWASPGGWCHRKKLALFSESAKLEYSELAEAFGAKWAFKLGDILKSIAILEYPDMRHVLADGIRKSEFDFAPAGIWDGINIRLGNMRDYGRLTPREAVQIASSVFQPAYLLRGSSRQS
jgi:hypothetical protein